MSEATEFYRQALDLSGAGGKKERAAALERAHEIRQFEIELYWKRANYFWLLQAAVFAAVGLTWKSDPASFPRFVPLVLSSLGLTTAWAAWLGTQGSKFWQRNWEHHIDMLETEFEGNLYKTVYVGPSGVKWSLSGISENLALLFSVFWGLILLTVSVWANANWSFEPSELSSCLTRTEVFTVLSWAFGLGGCIFLYSKSSGVKGKPQPYNINFATDHLNPPKARLFKEPNAKPYLLRRKPDV